MPQYDLSSIAAVSAAAEQARTRAGQEPDQNSYNAAWLHGYAQALTDTARQMGLRQRDDTSIETIRFCDSHYNTLFEIPNGGNIVITHFDGRQEILPCHFIDDSQVKVGETVFGLLEFAEIQERNGSVYAPEHPGYDDICDTYTIYQILNARDVPYCFRPYESAKGLIRQADYERVYTGVLARQTTLEDIYAKHNRDRRPFGQRMRSLSVSDIIVLNRDGKQRAYYTDTFGFARANEFLRKSPQRKRTARKREKSDESR